MLISPIIYLTTPQQQRGGEGKLDEHAQNDEGAENFKKPEVMRMILSCAGKNQAEALKSILPHISARSGEIAGGRSGVLSGICKQALTIACAKGNCEVAELLVKWVNVNYLDSCLSQCAAKGEIHILGTIVGEMEDVLGTDDEFFLAAVRQVRRFLMIEHVR